MIGKTLGHYRITEKLAKAAWAWSTKPVTPTSTVVAIKVLPGIKSPPRPERRFVRRRSRLGAESSNIIHVYDISFDAGHDFIAMEYVGGKPWIN